ncbi:MAG: glycosyltransferase family 4 protein [Chloroflexi bacterium]|nr:glycosyltransferase family 4 protein [Chloroflexota bacterium]
MAKKTKHICMLLMGGIQYDGRVRKESRSLATAGYWTTVITMPASAENTADLAPVAVREVRLLTRRIFGQVRGLPAKYGEFILRSAARGALLRADAYHAHDLPTLLPAYLAARCTGARLVYDAHELWTEQGTRYSDREAWRKLERWLLRRVDGVVAVNNSRATIMHEEYGSRVKPVVVRNCPPASNSLDRSSQPLRRFVAAQGASEAIIVLYQGSIAAERGYEALVDAAEFFESGTVAVLLGYGNDAYVASLHERVRRKGLEGKVFFHPAVPNSQILEYTASADLGVVFYDDSCRNNRYCAPNKLYDYMMTGIPSVASDLPGIQEVVQADDVGVTVDSKDPKAVAAAVNGLLHDRERYDRQRRNALRLAREKYNWERQEQQLLGLYTNLVGGA